MAKKHLKMCSFSLAIRAKKSEIMKSAGKWMELENIIFSEVSQKQNEKYMCCLLFVAPTFKSSGVNRYFQLLQRPGK